MITTHEILYFVYNFKGNKKIEEKETLLLKSFSLLGPEAPTGGLWVGKRRKKGTLSIMLKIVYVRLFPTVFI